MSSHIHVMQKKSLVSKNTCDIPHDTYETADGPGSEINI